MHHSIDLGKAYALQLNAIIRNKRHICEIKTLYDTIREIIMEANLLYKFNLTLISLIIFIVMVVRNWVGNTSSSFCALTVETEFSIYALKEVLLLFQIAHTLSKWGYLVCFDVYFLHKLHIYMYNIHW